MTETDDDDIGYIRAAAAQFVNQKDLEIAILRAERDALLLKAGDAIDPENEALVEAVDAAINSTYPLAGWIREQITRAAIEAIAKFGGETKP